MKPGKYFYGILIATLILSGLSACKTNTRTMNKNYTVEAFDAIESTIVGNVVFTQANEIKVTAEGAEDLVKNLIVEVENGTLKLSERKKMMMRWPAFNKKRSLTVQVSAPTITAIGLDGVGNIKLNGDVRADDLFIDLSGVGNLKAEDLQCRHFSIESNGVGNITLEGRTESIKIVSNDVGNVDAEEFAARVAHVNISGVGNVKCYASDTLNVIANGVGNVTYFGNPPVKKLEKNGVGKVINGDN